MCLCLISEVEGACKQLKKVNMGVGMRVNSDTITFDKLCSSAPALLSRSCYGFCILHVTWGREGNTIFSPSLLREEFSDVQVWDEVRGPVFIFDREVRRNGSDRGPCDVEISRSGLSVTA